MLVLVSAVVFGAYDDCIGLSGSLPSLGSWDPSSCQVLSPQQTNHRTSYVPTSYATILQIPEIHYDQHSSSFSIKNGSSGSSIQVKLIKWKSTNPTHNLPPADSQAVDPFTLPPLPADLSPSADQSPSSTIPLVDQCKLKINLTTTPRPVPGASVQYEGYGSRDNRQIYLVAPGTPVKDQDHVLDEANFTVTAIEGFEGQLVYILPPMDFIEIGTSPGTGGGDEFQHTSRYYETVKALRRIHFNQVLPRIFCGSCPRRLKHLDLLKNDYNVGVVFNLQADEDVHRNWIDDDAFPDKADRTSSQLHKIYKERGILLVHLPTTDMCTEARAAMMAQAALLMSAAYQAHPNRCIYVHCNAGVGRAVACTVAFLRFAAKLSEAHVRTLIRHTRTVAYFDQPALRAAHDDYVAKYGDFGAL